MRTNEKDTSEGAPYHNDNENSRAAARAVLATVPAVTRAHSWRGARTMNATLQHRTQKLNWCQRSVCSPTTTMALSPTCGQTGTLQRVPFQSVSQKHFPC